MYLAHEIAVDKDFMLEKLKPEVQPGSMEEHVKNIVHQAFWDVLRTELSEDPPVYNQALNLLTEIRDTLIGMVPKNHRAKNKIEKKLNIENIAQKAENRVLDVKEHGLFIIDLLGKLCTPERDQEVANLHTYLDDLVQLFKEIVKV